MFRDVLSWVATRFGSDEGEDESADTPFVPSVLDASVRYAHGTSNTGVEREMATIRDEARRLEDQRRES